MVSNHVGLGSDPELSSAATDIKNFLDMYESYDEELKKQFPALSSVFRRIRPHKRTRDMYHLPL